MSTKLANASQQDTSTTSDQITAYMNAYGLDSNMEELSKALDAWAEVANVSAADVGELAAASQKAASTANTVGVSMDQLASQIATIESVTKDAPENIGNGLKTIYARFSDISMGETLDDGVNLGQVTGALSNVGVDVLDSNGKMREVGNIMEDLMDVWGQMDTTQKNAIATTLAGKYQLARFEALMNRSDLYDSFKQSAQEGKDKGTLDVMNEKYVESLEGRLNKLQATFEGVLNNFFNSSDFYGFVDGLTQALELLESFVNSLGDASNLLLGIASIIGSITKQQIGTGISNFISNRQREKIEGKNEATKAQLLSQFGTDQESKLTDSQKSILNYAQKTTKLSSAMSEEQKERQNDILNRQLEAERKANLSSQKYNDDLMSTALAYQVVTGDSSLLSKGKDGKIDLTDFAKTYYTEPEGMKISAKELQVYDGQFGALYEAFSNIEKKTVKITEDMQAISKAGGDVAKTENAILDGAIDISSVVGKLRKEGIFIPSSMKEILNLLDQMLDVTDLEEKEVTELLAKIKEVAQEQAKAAQGASKGSVDTPDTLQIKKDQAAADKKSLEAVDREGQGFVEQLTQQDILTKITGIVAGLGSLAFAIQTVQNLGSIWSNDDLTIGDKILETIMNVSMALPMLVSGASDVKDGITTLGDAWVTAAKARIVQKTAEAAANEAEAVTTAQATAAEVAKSAANEVEAATATAATTANVGLAASMAAVAAPILAVVAALAAVGVAVYAAVEAYNADANAANAAAEQQKAYAESLQNTSSEFSTFETNIDSYEKARAALGELTQGTDEYNNKLQEVNQSLMEALDIYPELAKYVTRSSDGSLYIASSDLSAFESEKENLQSKGNSVSNILKAAELQASLKSDNTDTRRKITVSDIWDDNAKHFQLPDVMTEKEYASVMDLISYSGEQSVFNAQAVGEAIGKSASDPMTKAIVEGGDKLVEAFHNQQDQERAIQLQREEGLKNYLGSEYEANSASTNALSFLSKDNGFIDKSYDRALNDMSELDTKTLASWYASLIGGKADGEKVTNAQGEELDVTRETMQSALASAQALESAAKKWNSVAEKFANIADSSFSQDVDVDTGSMLEQWQPNGEIDVSGIGKTKQRELSNWLEEGNDLTPEDLGIDDDWAIDAGFESAQSFAESFSNGLEEALSGQTELDNLLNGEAPGNAKEFEEQAEKIKKLVDELDELESAYDRGYLSESDYDDKLIELSSNYKDVSEEVNELKTAQKEAKKVQEDYIEALFNYGKDSKEAKEATEKLEKAQKNLRETQSKLKSAMLLQEWVDAKDKVNEYLDALDSAEQGSDQYNESIRNLSDEFTAMLGVDISSWSDAQKEAFFTNEQNANDLRAALNGDYEAYMRVKVAASNAIFAKLNLDDTQFRDVLTGIQQYATSGEFATLVAGATIDDQEFLNTLATMLTSMNLTADQIDGICKGLASININAEVVEWEEIPTAFSYSDSTESANPGMITGVTETKKIPKRIVFTKTGGTDSDYRDAFRGSGGSANTYPSSDDSGSGSGGSGGSGGGSDDSGSDDNYDDSVEEFLEDEHDLYEKVNTELEKTENHLDGIAEKYDRLVGFEKIDNMDEQIADYNKLIDLQKQKLEIERQEAEDQKNKLLGFGITFDENGIIQNYADVYNRLLQDYNALVTEYNNSTDKAYKETLKEQMEAAKESLDNFEDCVDRYDELIGDEILSAENQIEEYYHKIEDMRIEAMKDAYDAVDDLKDLFEVGNQLEGLWSGYDSDSPFRDLLTDVADLEDYFNLAEGAADTMYDTIIQRNRELANQATTDEERDKYNKIADWYENAKETTGPNGTGTIDVRTRWLNYLLSDEGKSDFGSNTAEYVEMLKQAYKDTAQEMLDAEQKYKDAVEAVVDGYEEISDEFDKVADSYDQIIDNLDHTVSMIETLDGDQAYDKIIAITQKQVDVYNDALKQQRQSLDYWEGQLQNAISQGLDDDIISTLKEKVADAQSELNDLAESAAEAVKTIYENETDKYLEAFKNAALGTDDADFQEMQWEQAKTNAEQYLDTVERAYQVEKLRNKYQQMINNSNDPTIQKQISKAMKEQLEYLNSKVKLSEYDLNYANAQLEVLQKRIALEEAQRNKSTMKLKRDSQGNYSYVYTADQDDLLSKQQDLADAENNGYEISKENYSSQVDNYMTVINNFVENARQIREKYANDEATATAQIQALWDQVSVYLSGIQEQLSTSEQNMLNSVKQLALDSVGDVSNTYSDIASSMETNMDEALENIGVAVNESVVEQIRDLNKVDAAADTLQKNLRNSAIKYKDTATQMASSAKNSYDKVETAIDSATAAQKKLTDASKEFWNLIAEDQGTIDKGIAKINEYKDAVEGLKDSESKTAQALKDALAQLAQEKQTSAYWEDMYIRERDGLNDTDTGGGDSGSGDSGNGSDYTDEEVAFGIAQNIYTYGSWADDPVRRDRIVERWGEAIANRAQEIVNEHYANGTQGELVNRDSDVWGYDTGGYTGTWSDQTIDSKNGKVAFLHQKELVLNSSDTENILAAIDIVRNMTDSLKSGGLSTNLNNVLNTLGTATSGLGSSVDQNVHITAEFPNATDADDIRQALLSLNERAYQVASQPNDFSSSVRSFYYQD